MAQANPPFVPLFGAGAPAIGAPQGTYYYDTAAAYKKYVRQGGAWHAVAAVSVGTVNATQLQGRNVSATPPADGQRLKWVAANNDWEPG